MTSFEPSSEFIEPHHAKADASLPPRHRRFGSRDANGQSPALHRSRLLASVALAGMALLVGCGGGDADEPRADSTDAAAPQIATIKVYPAVPGLVLVDEGSGGEVLRQSTATDDAGGATFDKAPEGARLRTVDKADPWRVPVRRSARLRGTAPAVELTPLTTIFDQLVSSGMPESAAQARVRRLIDPNCGVTPETVPGEVMYGDRPLIGPPREWLLPALGAYLDALGNIGMASDTPGVDWASLLDAHPTILARLCATARTVHSTEWLASATRTLATGSGLNESAAHAAVQAIRQQALAQVLALEASRVAVRLHPTLERVVEPQEPTWLADEAGLVTDLAAAAAARSQDGSASSLKGIGLDPDGRIVQIASGRTTWTDSASPPLRFVNRSAENRSVRVEINGVALHSLADLVREVLAMPAEQADEPLHRRAWRYVVQRRTHSWPITGGIFQHQPELFLRSVGLGFCDDVAAVLARMWRAMGYEARVIGLSGHVVPEVLVEGRWELYDPDYGVYYVNPQGTVASVADIAGNGNLLTSPLLRLSSASIGAYDASLAALYTSVHDNSDASWLMQASSAPFAQALDLPSGATLELRGGGSLEVPTIEAGISVVSGSLRLHLPRGFVGKVQLPYVLTDVSGDGRVVLYWQSVDVPPQGLAPWITSRYNGTPSVGIPEIDIERVGSEGLTLTMMVNPSLTPRGVLTAALSGPSVDGIEVSEALR